MAHMSMSGIGGASTSISSNISNNDLNNSTSQHINTGNVQVPLERRCDDPDCHVYKMVSQLPKCSTPQFVTEPVVTEKPLLINGLTTIFQIEGKSAKLADIKNPIDQKPLYRIVPNTHAHIINYVVVDTDTETLRKINDQDPAIMRKLLDSQKESADQMLKKLIAGHNPSNLNVSTCTPALQTSTTTSVGSVGGGGSVGGTITPIAVTKLMPTLAKTTPTTSKQQQNSTMQLPTSIHPNLKITAVASAEGTMMAGKSVSSLLSQSLSNNSKLTQQQQQQQMQTTSTATMPLITPVPLANLQRASVSTAPNIVQHAPSNQTMNILPTQQQQQNINMGNLITPSPTAVVQPLQSSTISSGIGDIVDKPVFDKMQKELEELRRTVERLAKAQANQNQN